MADTKISGLTTDTAPDRIADFVPTYDASAIATKKVALGNLGRYELLMGFANSSPSDVTTYYFGSYLNTTLQSTGGARRLYVTRAGVIRAVYLTAVNSGTAGTGETSTIYLRVNNTTDTTLFSNFTTNGAGMVFASGAGITVAVAQGDYIELKWITPTWATNPTGLYVNAQVIME